MESISFTCYMLVGSRGRQEALRLGFFFNKVFQSNTMKESIRTAPCCKNGKGFAWSRSQRVILRLKGSRSKRMNEY
jgi:hypothetical protein